MIKKLFMVAVLCIGLCGCATYSDEIFIERMNAYLATLSDELDVRVNNTTDYFSYYLPSDMTEGECYEEGVVFYYSNSGIIMNVNVAGLINKDYYEEYRLHDEGFFDSNTLVYVNSGSYLDGRGVSQDYFLNIYEYEGDHLIHMMSDELNIYAYSLKEETYETAKHIFLIARSAEVDTEEVLANYTAGDVIDYTRKQVDLFQYVIPKSGYLTELLAESEN